jgi:hypothetical protein
MNGLVRPVGPAKIVRTEVRAPDVLVARLSGAVRAEVATVKCGQKYYFWAPPRLGGIQEIAADSLTDGLHAAVWNMNEKLSSRKKK